jgi:hypothetical protein
MEEERREGGLDDRRRIRYNPQPPGNILSNITEQKYNVGSQPPVESSEIEAR